MEAGQASSSDVASWWWSHRSIVEEAEPLDATADDAAASCLCVIVKQTANNVLAYKNDLLALIGEVHPARKGSADSVSQHNRDVGACGLYQHMKWDYVLLPLLTQLRKCMARAWEERAAEQAEQAADDTTPASAAAVARSGAKVTPAAHIDAVQARRLRALQQQIYLAFFKAVLQGFTDGARGAAETGADTSNAVAGEEGCSVGVQGRGSSETANVTPAARALSLLLDSLLTHVLSFATAGAAAASSHVEEEEATKSRRGQHRRAVAATGTHTGDWLTGMLPLYLRAAYQQQQRAHDDVAEQRGVALASTSASLIPSPVLCLVSYIGAFVQGAGLQLVPSEQEEYLPCFTRKVHSEFSDQLRSFVQAAAAQSEYAAAGVASSDAVAAAAAHIRYAGDVLKAIIDRQLYSDDNATEVGEGDCTMAYAAVPPLPALRAQPQKSETPIKVDYSVAPLLVLSSYKVCERLLRLMSRWWVACQHMARHARMSAAAAVPRMEEEGNVEGEKQQQQQQGADGPNSGNDTIRLEEVEEAWLGLRKQAMAFTLVLSTYGETTLLIAPYTAFLTTFFFTPAPNGTAPSAEKQAPLSLEAWKGCVRELHRVTHATQDGGYALFTHTTCGARRQLRMHHRHARDCTFAAACFSRVMECLSYPPTGAQVPGQAAAAGTDRQAHSVGSHSLLPLAFAALQQPLSTMQEHVFPLLLRVGSVALGVRVDAVVREKGGAGDPGATPDASNVNLSTHSPNSDAATTSATRAQALTEEPLSAVQLVELYFPRYYRVFSCLDQAMQYVLDRFQELAGDNAAVEETADGDVARMWASPRSLPATLASFFGAALDEACVTRMRNTGDEVATSELLMFFAAVFRTLPSTVLPRLRAALEAFLGEGGCTIIEYLRHHIIHQQRHGLAAFFVPPLRAMALDYATAEDADVSLALTAKYPASCAMAYAWELPRLYFWRAEDTPVAESAWYAHRAAQRYLCELVTAAPATISTSSAPFLAILQEAAAVANGRFAEPHESAKMASGLFWTRSLAIDVMTSVFFGMCRWCALQMSVSSSSLSAEAAATVIQHLCCPRPTSVTLLSPHVVAHPLLLSLRDRVKVQLGSNVMDAAESEGAVAGTENAEAVNSPGVAYPPPAQQQLRSSHRWLSWFWVCTYEEVDSAARMQTAAKRLLREFSVQCGSHAPTKTLLGIRAMVEQLKTEGVPDMAVAVHELREAVRGDLRALLLQQQQREASENENATAVASTEGTKEATITATTATSSADAAGAVLKPATLRDYLDQIHEALVQRARISPVDGAVSAATLGHLLHVLSDAHLPITMSVQERQRMCQRFFFTLANSLAECTRTEALSSVCCLRCVLQDIVLPYKKSFLIESSAARVYHRCFSDTETDAFRMVQHMCGDVIMAVQKIVLRNGILDEWKMVLVLQHLGDPLSLVRSTVEKLRSTVERLKARRRGVVMDVIARQLAVVEKSAARTDRGVADDVHGLFTLHPRPSSSSSPAARAAEGLLTASSAAAAPVERSSSGRRTRGDRRERERRNEKDRKRSRDDCVGGDGDEKPWQKPRTKDSKRYRADFKRPRR